MQDGSNGAVTSVGAGGFKSALISGGVVQLYVESLGHQVSSPIAARLSRA